MGFLLQRATTRRITVTPEGREYYEKARCLLEDFGRDRRVFQYRPQHSRRAIYGSPSAGRPRGDVLIPQLADSYDLGPDIRIDLQVADKPADLISGNIDCAIRGGPMEDSTLIARKIGEATLVTLCHPGLSSALRHPRLAG